MHTFNFEATTIHYSSDLSGMVEVHYGAHAHNKMQFPGDALKAFLAMWLRNQRIAAIEQMTDSQILGEDYE